MEERGGHHRSKESLLHRHRGTGEKWLDQGSGEIDFVQGEAKRAGITFTHDLRWETHCNRMNLAEAAWACISRLGASRGGLSQTAWRQVYTGSIRAIATYGWELECTGTAMEKLWKLQYKAVRKVTGGYHGARQFTLENIARVEPVPIKLWDMRVGQAEKGVQDSLIEEVEKYRGAGRSWKDHSLAWAQTQNSRNSRQYNTSLEEILERKLNWDSTRPTDTGGERAWYRGTPRVPWELRIRQELEDEG